jgi:FAD:protein FMN transferase
MNDVRYCLWFLIGLPFLCMGQELHRFQFEHPQMGTLFRITVYAPDKQVAERGSQLAFDRLDDLNQQLSDYEPESALNQFDATAGDGAWHALTPDLWQVLHEAQEVYRKSDGAFDVSIGPLSRLWRRAFRRQEFPDVLLLAEAKKRVNGNWIKLKRQGCRGKLLRLGMELDLGGIAKGYALDEMANVLTYQGLNVYLIDGGGDLLAGTAPPGRKGWRIQRPQGASILLEREAIATSGDSYRYLEHAGERYSHLIDPRTGYGVQHERIVSVRAPTATRADAWASAFSILSAEDILLILSKPWAQSLTLLAP